MKRGYIRCLWGDDGTQYDEGWIKPSERRIKMDREIKIAINNPNTVPFSIYVFGKRNYEHLMELKLQEMGIPCILLDDNPWLYDPQKEFWKHKLDILHHVMNHDGYDELIYLDWDCVPIKPVPETIWDQLHTKTAIQANLQFYRRRKCHWRGDLDTRKVSNGGFLYIGNKLITDKLLEVWKNMPVEMKFWDEVCISKLTDEIVGGWKGLDVYWDYFEPEVCNLKKRSAFPEERIMAKNYYFLHYVQSRNNRENTGYGGGTQS